LEMKSRRIVSLVPAATEIATALGLIQEVVGVSHRCDYPAESTSAHGCCPIHQAGEGSMSVQFVHEFLKGM